MSYVVFVDENGSPVTVSAANPLPTTGAGGGGLQASDITATAPVTWNSSTTTIAVTKAAHVANADPTSLATLAASVDALRTALVTAGLMAAS